MQRHLNESETRLKVVKTTYGTAEPLGELLNSGIFFHSTRASERLSFCQEKVKHNFTTNETAVGADAPDCSKGGPEKPPAGAKFMLQPLRPML